MSDGELIPALSRSELISLYVQLCYFTTGPSQRSTFAEFHRKIGS